MGQMCLTVVALDQLPISFPTQRFLLFLAKALVAHTRELLSRKLQAATSKEGFRDAMPCPLSHHSAGRKDTHTPLSIYNCLIKG